MPSARAVRCLPVAALLVSLCLPPAFAATSLLRDHFGVNLSVAQRTDYVAAIGGNYTRYVFNNSWVPTSPTADYVVSDWSNYWSNSGWTQGDQLIAGGEPYDVEALYFDDDRSNIYLAVVTSFDGPVPYGGHPDPRVGNIIVPTGDLAFDLHLNGPASGVDSFNYDYGININNEVRQPSGGGTPNAQPALGNKIYRTLNSDWYCSLPGNAEATPRLEQTNFDPAYSSFGGSPRGAASVFYTRVDFGGPLENGYDTYVIEATIPRSSFPLLSPGDTVGIQYSEGCRNDGSATTNVLRTYGQVDTPTPEPVPCVLLGFSLLSLVASRRRSCRRRRRLLPPPDCRP